VTADCNLITQLLYCLSANISCDLVASYLIGIPSNLQTTNYVGVYNWEDSYSLVSHFINAFLGNTTGQVVGECNKSTNYKCSNSLGQCIGGKTCVITSVHYHPAISPAFNYDVNNGVWSIVNDSEPTFVESFWGKIGVRIFLQDSPVTAVIILIVGILEFGGFCVGAYFLNQFLNYFATLTSRTADHQ